MRQSYSGFNGRRTEKDKTVNTKDLDPKTPRSSVHITCTLNYVSKCRVNAMAVSINLTEF